MNSANLTSIWHAFAPALGNHLWQSTLFAVLAGLLTLALRKNQARARYWLWLVASLKFLIPFSWLVAIGGRFAWSHALETGSGMYDTIEEISQPFAQPASSAVLPVTPATISFPAIHLLPAIFTAVWLCGFVAVLFLWCLRWRRISAAIRQSQPLREGREVEALRRIEHTAGISQRVEMLLSRATLEPGVFGMSRPTLLWPEGISQHLETAHLEAILAHELWHVRRRDNLAAALHMLVEAVFWFHPLVWWLGARLVDERERACDEEVLERGSERHVYAESILKVCEFCVGSPLACVAGVTGSDLKKRMVHIMSEQVARKLDLSKKLLLAVAGAAAIAAPIVFGLIHATPSHAQSQSDNAAPARFESFTIAPAQPSALGPGEKTKVTKMMFGPDKGFVAANITLQSVIQDAYGVQANQIVGAPDWLNSERFDIEGKVTPSQGADGASREPFTVRGPDAPKVVPDVNAVKLMMQAALADRAKLVVHTETRVLPTYTLVVAEGGSKLQPSQVDNASAEGSDDHLMPQRKKVRFGITVKGDAVDMEANTMSVDDLADYLARALKLPVVNKTGLSGKYDLHLHWNNEPKTAEGDNALEAANSAPAILAAVQEQLGLKLEPQKALTPVLVVDHIEKPTTEQSENQPVPVEK
jgi:bla regulator protein blaR1